MPETVTGQTVTGQTVTGQTVTIVFNGSRCIHSRGCVLGQPTVFVPNVQGEWIHPDGATPDMVMRTAYNCSSGAIRVMINDGSGSSDAPPVVNTLRIRENGPLAIEAEVVVAGVVAASPRATLCRCGQSGNKPYCDGAHVAAGFIASGEPETKVTEPLSARNGPVLVEPQPNGSLKLTGNLEIVSGTGRTVNKVTSTWLCRCGQSQNKPYCDGSHKAAGFIAP